MKEARWPLEGVRVVDFGHPYSLRGRILSYFSGLKSLIAAVHTAISTGRTFFVSINIWSADSTFTTFTFSGFFKFEEGVFFEVEGLGDVGKAVITADQKKSLNIDFDSM